MATADDCICVELMKTGNPEMDTPAILEVRLLHLWQARYRKLLTERIRRGETVSVDEATTGATLVRKIPQKDPQCFLPRYQSLSLHLPECPCSHAH